MDHYTSPTSWQWSMPPDGMMKSPCRGHTEWALSEASRVTGLALTSEPKSLPWVCSGSGPSGHGPYLYTQDEIRRLLEAAQRIKSPHPLQAQTYYCLFGLLAVSGMRLGEALNLQPQDVDWEAGVLTIRGAKFGKSRLVPLHPSTRSVLLDYARRRDEIYSRRPVDYFFVTSRGTKLEKPNLSRIFRELSRQVGIRKPGLRHGPRLHDFRHRFAVETLLGWYRRGEKVTRRLPVLSTYLGHSNVTGTYWYLSNTPELMTAAGKLLETRWKGVL